MSVALVEEHYKVGVKSTQEFGWRLQKEVDEQYKMGVTATKKGFTLFQKVSEHYKAEVTTTPIENHRVCNEIENQYKEIQTTNNQLEFYSEKDVEELYEQNIN